MSFEITVVELPAKHLIGMSVRTDMRKAQTDCPAVWQTFGPRIAGIPGRDGAGQGAYGVSFMLNENDFDYRAAVEAAPGTTVPDGMAAFEIPSGRYARCGVASFEQLGEAYMYVYGQWAPGQSDSEHAGAVLRTLPAELEPRRRLRGLCAGGLNLRWALEIRTAPVGKRSPSKSAP